MNKKLEAKLNIADIASINPYSDNKQSLAYNIINNAIVGKTGTNLAASPLTKVAKSISVYDTPGVYNYEKISTDTLCAGFDAWFIGQTEEEAQMALYTVSSYEEAAESYVFDACEETTKYLVSYDETTDILTFRVEQTNEKTLSVSEDDHGTSYYYRGNVEDNYVNFAGMCWRIVRINGDGSTKLILEDQDQTCGEEINGNWAIPTTKNGTIYTGNFGWTQYGPETLKASDGTTNQMTKHIIDYPNGKTDGDKSMATAFKNFQSLFTQTELEKLKAGDWCLGDAAYDNSHNLLTDIQILDFKVKGKTFYYDSFRLLSEDFEQEPRPTLKCSGTVLNDWGDIEKTPMYVGAITADEVVYAGGKYNVKNQNYYLVNEEFMEGSAGENKSDYFWTLSPISFSSHYDVSFFVGYSGSLTSYGNVGMDSNAFRPLVNLRPNVIIEGKGTIDNPYIIK